MQEGFKLEKSTSIEDAVVLDIMEKLIEGAGRTFSMKAERLLSKIKNQSFNPFYAKLDMEDIGDKLREVQQLESVIKSHQEIACLYDFGNYAKTIDLKPLKIANYEGFWYLIALDARNDTLKKYYLKNISQIHIKDQEFEADTTLDDLLEQSLSVWFDQGIEPYRVVLEISDTIAKYFRRKPLSKTQRIEELREDGSLVISVEITSDMEIIPFVKYWMPHIRVVEPVGIRKSIAEDLHKYLEDNEK
jgi:predicted DNA-binding transcriptional regulator YafY